MVNYIISYTADKKPIGEKVLVLNKLDKNQLQNKFDEYAAKMQPGDILEYIRDDLSSKKMGGTLLYVENEKGINYIYNLNNNRKKKYKVQPTAQPKSEAYGKPKQGVQNNYPKEIAQQTGTRESSVATWLKTNEVDPMTILQGVGSGRIKRQDFVEALLSDEGTLEFLNKYNSDGKWSSVWKATPKNTQESLSEMIRRVIKEESATELSPGEVFVSFGSHRARDYATRALGELPNSLYSFTSGTHLYKVNQDQLAKLSGSKRIVMKQYKKLPKGEWLNSWKR